MTRRTPLSLFFTCILAVTLLTSASAQNDVDPYFEKIDFANGLFQRGLYDMAASEYGEFLNQYPDSTHAHEAVFGMGESFFFTQDYAKATQYYQDYVSQFANRDK
ncbi:MAG: tetratricopeptide repeat protein, partial [Candidatus Omnitrophica bacterium]|nr:tetratricopeptide repeat protein [Candidatus Omnitrophota bacterium]